MNHDDPRGPTSGSAPGCGEEDSTARLLRHGLTSAGRGVHAPAGIAAAALRGGRRRRRRRRAALAAPVALVAVLGGVGAGAGWPRPGADPVRTVPAAEQARDGERAAETVAGVLAQLAPENAWPVHPEIAEVVLIDRCIAEQGLDVERVPLTAATSLDQAIARGTDPGDLQAWAAHGSDYGMTSSIRQALQHPPTGALGEFAHGIPEGYETALNGDPVQELTLPIGDGGSLTVVTTGCAGRAVRELYGVSVEQYERASLAVSGLPEQLQEAVQRDAEADGRLRSAAREWSQCMEERGHEVDTPSDLPLRLQEQRRDLLLDEAGGSAADQADLDAFAAFEASLAEADRACKDASGLGPAFAETLTRHWNRLAGEHAAELVTHRGLLEHARVVAGRLAAGTGDGTAGEAR